MINIFPVQYLVDIEKIKQKVRVKVFVCSKNFEIFTLAGRNWIITYDKNVHAQGSVNYLILRL